MTPSFPMTKEPGVSATSRIIASSQTNVHNYIEIWTAKQLFFSATAELQHTRHRPPERLAGRCAGLAFSAAAVRACAGLLPRRKPGCRNRVFRS
jgi:hypothetical protein